MVSLSRVTLPALLCCACASAGQDTAPAAPETVNRVYIPGGSGSEMYNAPGVGARTLSAPVDSVWRALPRVYELLGVPEPGARSGELTYGNPSFRARRIEGKRLSNYIDCGSGPTAVPNADQYEVTFSLLTGLTRADGGGTVTLTTVDATARPRAVTGNPVHCQSKGTLESRVAELIMWILVGGN